MRGMGLRSWFYIRPRPGELRRLALRKVEDFFSHGGQLPIGEEGQVQYAEVMVRLEDRQAVGVVRLSYFQYHARADGTLDRRSYMEMMATAGEAAFGGSSLKKAPPGVVNAEHRFAQRRLDHLSRWTPTKDEVEILRGIVNRRARRELL